MDWQKDHKRIVDCLLTIREAPSNVTMDAVRSVAYDVVFNCITSDVVEHQLVVRSGLRPIEDGEAETRENDARQETFTNSNGEFDEMPF